MAKKGKECIAMLLAGGQGSRLSVLTENTAKPAIPFGGKYRIIDFPLSNCVNSGIDTVGILTQYMPLELNEYIGNGQPWGLNRNFGGARILPPYVKSKNSEWYKGTANAVFQNFHFIEQYNPSYVIILSADHIYKMDYSRMLDFHKKKNAVCTIAVIDVPIEEASRFGIMNLNPDGSVYEFEEKPENPKSTKASMGIYVFDWCALKKYLTEDDSKKQSDHDFGKNIIPNLIADDQRVFAYLFDGYWKDVGTIESLWEANMDLLGSGCEFRLKDVKFKIYARNYAKPASYIAPSAVIKNSFVAEGCEIYGLLENSVISTGCVVEEDAIIKHSIVMPDSTIKRGSKINYSIVGQNVVIGRDAIVGEIPEKNSKTKGITVIGKDKKVEDSCRIEASEII